MNHNKDITFMERVIRHSKKHTNKVTLRHQSQYKMGQIIKNKIQKI